MGKFVKGDVVVLPFPFSGLSTSKKRPALVIAKLRGDDIILTRITTTHSSDEYSISLLKADFTSGGINQDSNIRPNKLFTGDSNIVTKIAGRLSQAKTDEVVNRVVQIIRS